MPELPEVETIRRGLERRILRKIIRRIEIRDKKIVKNQPREFVRALQTNSFEKIDRRGKLLILTLARGKQFLLVHLKMTGQLIYQSKNVFIAGGHPIPPLRPEGLRGAGLPHKHTHVVINFSDGSKLFFNDLRKFGVMKIVDGEAKDLILTAYGVEPLDFTRGKPQFTWERFQKALGKRQASLKAVLLNQALIAGLGNIYVDEVCWHAKVRPSRRVARLTLAERKHIFQNIPKVLREAISRGGTTFNHFRDSEGEKGNYTDQLKVYGRAGKKCLRPACRQAGVALIKSVVAQRGTVYCPICQK